MSWRVLGPLAVLHHYLALLQRDVINVDGALYLQMSALLQQGQWQAAWSLYHWPLYSLLVASLAHLTGLELLAAADLLGALSSALLLCAFVRCLQALGASQAVCVAGAVLLLTQPWLNDARILVARDVPYLALLFLAIALALHWLHCPRRYMVWALVSVLMMATLLRIEALLLLCGVPLLPAVRRGTLGLRESVFLLGATALVAALCAWWLYLPSVLALPQALFDRWQAQHALMIQWLGPHADQYATWVMLSALMAVWLGNIATRLGPLALGLLVWGSLRARPLWPAAERRLWWILVAVMATVLWLPLFMHGFITRRYTLSLTLLLLLPAAWMLCTAWQRSHRFGRVGWVMVLLASLLDGMVRTGPSAAYLRDAGAWLAQQPAGASVSSNSAVLNWYAGGDYRRGRWEDVALLDAVAQGQVQGWVALRTYHAVQRKTMKKRLNGEPLRRFVGARSGDEVWIYRIATKAQN